MADDTIGPFDAGSLPEDPDEGRKKRASVAADMKRRQRGGKAPSATAQAAEDWAAANQGSPSPGQPAPVAPKATSVAGFYDSKLQEQTAARDAYTDRRGMSPLAAKASQGADRAQAGLAANAQQAGAEAQRREMLRRTLISRVQDMMLPFKRAGLPPGGR